LIVVTLFLNHLWNWYRLSDSMMVVIFFFFFLSLNLISVVHALLAIFLRYLYNLLFAINEILLYPHVFLFRISMLQQYWLLYLFHLIIGVLGFSVAQFIISRIFIFYQNVVLFLLFQLIFLLVIHLISLSITFPFPMIFFYSYWFPLINFTIWYLSLRFIHLIS
jgi:hypothetical protein